MRIFRTVLLLALPLLAGCDPHVYDAKQEVARALIDPSSAQFDRIRKFWVDGRPLVCGTVNGKNRFGAMAGARDFIYREPLLRIADSDGEDYEIYKCCSTIGKAGTLGGAESTKDIPECSKIEPPMPLL